MRLRPLVNRCSSSREVCPGRYFAGGQNQSGARFVAPNSSWSAPARRESLLTDDTSLPNTAALAKGETGDQYANTEDGARHAVEYRSVGAMAIVIVNTDRCAAGSGGSPTPSWWRTKRECQHFYTIAVPATG